MPKGKKKNSNNRATNSGNFPIGQQGDITNINLEEKQTIPTEKDESIESIAANDDIIPEQQQDTTDYDVSGEEDLIGEKTSTEKNEHETAFANQDEDLIELGSDTKSINKDIEQTNKTNIDNSQVGQDSGFKELPFSEHSESSNVETEVVNTDNVHVELDSDDSDYDPISDDKNKSTERISETHNEAEIGQISAVQSLTSQYTTPPEVSESSDTKTINNDGLTSLDDGTDDEVSELEDILEPEEKSNLTPNTVHSSDDEDLCANAENLYKSNDTSKPELKEEENEHEIENIKTQSRKVSLSDDSDGESLTDDNPDSSTPDTQTSRMSEDSSILNDHNSPKKKVFKSPFANSSKGEKALLLFTALSSATFIASFIASILGKPLCPDEKGNLISLAILGTVAIVSITVSLAHFYCSNKSKENDPLSKFDSNEVEMLMLESKKNK
ncbi:MAG: hypothetical protein U0X86_000191 [Wolbachia endosymbiont of Xenopsylla cheopis]